LESKNLTAGVTQPDRVPVHIKLVHGLGSIAYGVKDNGFSTFLLIFYNQVIGLDAGLVGAAIMVALIADAFADPLIGHWSDHTRSRWGRRLPWLYLAPVPLGIAWMLLWHPPLDSGQALQIIWLIGFAIIVRTLVSCCEVPSIALVPELTSDYDERTRFMRYRFLFGWGGGLVLLILGYGYFFADDAGGQSGLTNPDGYYLYALFGAVMMAGSVLISAAGQHRYILSHPQWQVPDERNGLADMLQVLRNRPFLLLIAAALFGFINQGITFSLTNYLLSFVWQLKDGQLTAYALLLFASMVAAFLVVPTLGQRLGKRRGAVLCGAIALGSNTLLYVLFVTGIITDAAGQASIVALFAFVFVGNGFAIGLMILTSSMAADVVEASQAETGRRSEGLFFAGYFFMQKCATGIGIFFAGMILSWAQFPEGAQRGDVPADVLTRIAIAYPLTMLALGTIGILVMRRFPIDRDSHAARVAALNGAPAPELS
jgi:glycoside/pentoside/hexuronide:cation symporter, GPH family